MREISVEKIIDERFIRALNKGDKVENDVFCVEIKYNEYWVFFKHESHSPLFLGSSSSVFGARQIMSSFIYGCFYTTTGQITHK